MSLWPCRYRHGEETVDAFRWTGDDSQREEPQWAVDALAMGTMRICRAGTPAVRLHVHTESGWCAAEPGDWIVRSPSGRMEACGDKLFRKRCAAVPRLVKKTGKASYNRRGRPTIWSPKNRRPLPLP